MRGYKPGRLASMCGGRCEACRGDGILKIEMHFLPDVYVPCEVCAKRYNRETRRLSTKEKRGRCAGNDGHRGVVLLYPYSSVATRLRHYTTSV